MNEKSTLAYLGMMSIMFPRELTTVRRNWLNDNIDKTIFFNKSMNENMKEKDFIL